ncbi:MAG: hypothetical protein KDD03_02595 [Gelidibacter sp.]|nr:hypothetical protein [Gelidibacter sp.]
MSKINRSTYQKLAEENKRLKKDLKTLTYDNNRSDNMDEWIETFEKWSDYFEKEERMERITKELVKEYIKEHADELPDFLTGPGQK